MQREQSTKGLKVVGKNRGLLCQDKPAKVPPFCSDHGHVMKMRWTPCSLLQEFFDSAGGAYYKSQPDRLVSLKELKELSFFLEEIVWHTLNTR